jgi:hypothetical protein
MNASANSLVLGTYGPTTITLTNTTNGQGTTTRTATLTVNAPPGTPLYRFFSVVTGTHFYTINEAEKNAVIATLPEYHFEGGGVLRSCHPVIIRGEPSPGPMRTGLPVKAHLFLSLLTSDRR